jgi:hypothetical protein
MLRSEGVELERPCQLERKDHLKKRSVRVKTLADSNFATNFAWAISAYPQRAAIIMVPRQGTDVQSCVMLSCYARAPAASNRPLPSGRRAVPLTRNQIRRSTKPLILVGAQGQQHHPLYQCLTPALNDDELEEAAKTFLEILGPNLLEDCEATGRRCRTPGPHIIHSVTDPIPRLTGAIHLRGGDFFAAERSEWGSETLWRPLGAASMLDGVFRIVPRVLRFERFVLDLARGSLRTGDQEFSGPRPSRSCATSRKTPGGLCPSKSLSRPCGLRSPYAMTRLYNASGNCTRSSATTTGN